MEPEDLADDPLVQVQRWLDDAVAAGVFEPNAMSLATATVTADADADVRTVLLKGVSGGGLVFFTNYNSAKAAQLAARPMAAASLTWPSLGRQVRARGPVARTTPEESDAYFATRPRGSQLAAWASSQSEVIPSRAHLEALYAQVAARFDGVDVPRPPHWGGYRITPDIVEFWSRGESRLHDRLRYSRDGGGWRVDRLAP